jgi:hypothetical protein
MRVINMFTVSVAASLILSAAADASDARNRGEGSTGKSEVFNATGLPWDIQSFQRVSPVRAEHYPAPDWSSAIGTGRGATVVEGPQPVPPVSAQRYPEPDWTSAIGTGSAAALQRRSVRIDRASLPEVLR